MKKKKCKNCQKVFEIRAGNQKACSSVCAGLLEKKRRKKYLKKYYKTTIKPNRILSEETKRKNRKRANKWYLENKKK